MVDKIEDMLNMVQEPVYQDGEYNVSLFEESIEGHSYVMACDVGRGYGNDLFYV